MSYLGTFGLEFETYCHIWNQHPQIFLKAKFCAKMKILKSRTKNVFFLVFLGWNLKILSSCLKSVPSNFVWTKNAWFGYFGARMWKCYCHIWNKSPQIYFSTKSCARMKNSKFGTINALFGYFWAGI